MFLSKLDKGLVEEYNLDKFRRIEDKYMDEKTIKKYKLVRKIGLILLFAFIPVAIYSFILMMDEDIDYDLMWLPMTLMYVAVIPMVVGMIMTFVSLAKLSSYDKNQIRVDKYKNIISFKELLNSKCGVYNMCLDDFVGEHIATYKKFIYRNEHVVVISSYDLSIIKKISSMDFEEVLNDEIITKDLENHKDVFNLEEMLEVGLVDDIIHYITIMEEEPTNKPKKMSALDYAITSEVVGEEYATVKYLEKAKAAQEAASKKEYSIVIVRKDNKPIWCCGIYNYTKVLAMFPSKCRTVEMRKMYEKAMNHK